MGEGAGQQREQKTQGKKKEHAPSITSERCRRTEESFWPAFGYDGDLEEGPGAEFEAEFGRTGLNKPWEEFEATHLRAVPDYARFVANRGSEESGSGGEETVSDEGGKVDQGAQAEGDLVGGELADEEVESVTQVLMETVRESNLQNEICDGQPSDFRLPILDFRLGARTMGANRHAERACYGEWRL